MVVEAAVGVVVGDFVVAGVVVGVVAAGVVALGAVVFLAGVAVLGVVVVGVVVLGVWGTVVAGVVVVPWRRSDAGTVNTGMEPARLAAGAEVGSTAVSVASAHAQASA
jgi:hypothetical protein